MQIFSPENNVAKSTLRTMVFLRVQPMHGSAAQPRLQPLDEPQPLFAAGARIAQQVSVAAGHRRELVRREADRLHRRLERQRTETLAQQAREMLPVARESGELHANFGCRDIL